MVGFWQYGEKLQDEETLFFPFMPCPHQSIFSTSPTAFLLFLETSAFIIKFTSGL